MTQEGARVPYLVSTGESIHNIAPGLCGIIQTFVKEKINDIRQKNGGNL